MKPVGCDRVAVRRQKVLIIGRSCKASTPSPVATTNVGISSSAKRRVRSPHWETEKVPKARYANTIASWPGFRIDCPYQGSKQYSNSSSGGTPVPPSQARFPLRTYTTTHRWTSRPATRAVNPNGQCLKCSRISVTTTTTTTSGHHQWSLGHLRFQTVAVSGELFRILVGGVFLGRRQSSNGRPQTVNVLIQVRAKRFKLANGEAPESPTSRRPPHSQTEPWSGVKTTTHIEARESVLRIIIWTLQHEVDHPSLQIVQRLSQF